mgnify:CR=1 FL=1
MPDQKDALYAELEALTQELDAMRSEFLADNVLDDEEKALLAEMNKEIEALQTEIQALEAAETEAFVWEPHPLEAEVATLLNQPHLKPLFANF